MWCSRVKPKAKGQPKKYHHEIFVFILKKTRNEVLRADITSVVFIKALENLHKFHYKGVPFVAWLYRIASNETNMFFRKANTQRMVSLDSKEVIAFQDDCDLDGGLSYEYKISLFVKGMNRLSEEEVEYLELKYFEKLSHQEISYIKDISLANAKVKIHRIVKKLKTIIEKIDNE